MTEQRYRAVLLVEAGSSVTEVAETFGVSRQAVHRWLAWYRDEGLAGPPPAIADNPPPVQRRVSCRGAIQVARQRIHVGIGHAGATVDIHATDTTWRIQLNDDLLVEVPRTASRPVARFKVRKPEPPRSRHTDLSVVDPRLHP